MLRSKGFPFRVVSWVREAKWVLAEEIDATPQRVENAEMSSPELDDQTASAALGKRALRSMKRKCCTAQRPHRGMIYERTTMFSMRLIPNKAASSVLC